MSARPSKIVSVTMGLLIASMHAQCVAAPVTIVALGDSTTAPRNVGAAQNGRPHGASTQGENNSDPANPLYNVVNNVTNTSQWLYVYSDILRDELPTHGLVIKAVDNEGIGGNRTDQAIGRLAADVRAKSPEFVIVQFAINDSWWYSGQPVDLAHPDSSGSRIAMDFLAQTGGDGVLGNGNDHPHAADGNYTDNLRSIVQSLHSDGTKVILMTPNQLSPTGEPAWRNVLLSQYAQAVRNVAATEHTPLIDVWKLFNDYAALPGHSIGDLLVDSQHPGALGHRLTADALLQQIFVPKRSGRKFREKGALYFCGYLRGLPRVLNDFRGELQRLFDLIYHVELKRNERTCGERRRSFRFEAVQPAGHDP